MRVRHFHVRPSIPKELVPLQEIARNLWFSWNWEAVQLFIRLSPRLWEKSYQNPVQMLGAVPQADLVAAAKDESFVANVERVYRSFQQYMKGTAWFARDPRRGWRRSRPRTSPASSASTRGSRSIPAASASSPATT